MFTLGYNYVKLEAHTERDYTKRKLVVELGLDD